MQKKEKARKKLNPKLECILHIINILILISLCYAIYSNGKDLKCYDCNIHFNSQKAVNNMQNNFSVSVQTLFNYWNRTEQCYVFWDKAEGFIVDENIKNS